MLVPFPLAAVRFLISFFTLNLLVFEGGGGGGLGGMMDIDC